MRLFEDRLFQMFADRALMTMTGGGAEYGECALTASRITEGDADSWHREWTATADMVAEWGRRSDEKGHPVSAAEAFHRASTYYRVANFPIFGHPVDPRLAETFRKECEAFERMAVLRRLRPMEVDYEGVELHGYLCLAARDEARPTVVAVNGYDSNLHEMYWSHAVPALKRGYHCLLMDGPGQGGALIEQGLTLRPDWEHVLGPIVQRLLTYREVDRDRVAVMGWSLGGYLAARGAAGDPRVKALVVDPGQWDQLELLREAMSIPDELKEALPDLDPDVLEPYLAEALADRIHHWELVQRGQWVHGAATPAEYLLDLARYNISEVVEDIACPTFVAATEADRLSVRAGTFFARLRCPKTLKAFTRAEGAAGHCELWNRSRFTQQAFDWLSETLRHPAEPPLY
ncbi:alpha/beta hydrolase family protein [Actinocorallia libanotica]|uniref:Alpha/beta fold hydrolase n=1 Tax=Actinocorallia libanotica TaxID=46162 RepID=A0ABN1RDQ0_9ACTN